MILKDLAMILKDLTKNPQSISENLVKILARQDLANILPRSMSCQDLQPGSVCTICILLQISTKASSAFCLHF
jgi:hypothetical protein